jgi:vitamin B12 transporter
MGWIGSGSVWADGVKAVTDDDPVEAREVVVSATKTPLPISQVTSAIEVIRGEELEEKKIKTVVDVLSLAQGLTVAPGTTTRVMRRPGNWTRSAW